MKESSANYNSFLKVFLNPDLLKRKPDFKLCSNHYKTKKLRVHRRWDSNVEGQAFRDGNGWYQSYK